MLIINPVSLLVVLPTCPMAHSVFRVPVDWSIFDWFYTEVWIRRFCVRSPYPNVEFRCLEHSIVSLVIGHVSIHRCIGILLSFCTVSDFLVIWPHGNEGWIIRTEKSWFAQNRPVYLKIQTIMVNTYNEVETVIDFQHYQDEDFFPLSIQTLTSSNNHCWEFVSSHFLCSANIAFRYVHSRSRLFNPTGSCGKRVLLGNRLSLYRRMKLDRLFLTAPVLAWNDLDFVMLIILVWLLDFI